jgi:flagellin-like protein
MKIRNGIYAQRKAISPIIATVLIIAVTLIAAVAIGGFVFGIFGSASATANVQVTGAVAPAASFGTVAADLTAYTCASTPPTAASPATPYIVLANTGTASASVTGVTITWAGASNVFTPTATCTVGAAGATAVTAAATMYLALTLTPKLTVAPVSGQTYSITVTLSNGASVLYTGTFQ